VTGRATATILALLLALPAAGEEAAIPAHPRELRFPPLAFTLPDPAGLRHTLRNGVVVYIAEDHTLPLVDVAVQARIGAFLDPPGKDGLAALTGSLLRQGGTQHRPARSFDDAVEALAADLAVDTGDTRADVTLNCLSRDLDAGLDLLFDMLAHPAFAADRLEAEKAHLREAMTARNDEVTDVVDREWQWLLYGTEHVSSRYLTGQRLAALNRQDLIDFHARFWRPANFYVTVAGDVDARKVLERLDTLFAAWPDSGRPVPWPPPPSSYRPRPGVYALNLDVPQTQVVLGHLGGVWDGHWSDPANYAIEVLTEVLAGDLFTSRLGRRLRGTENLIYGMQSRSGLLGTWPDTFQIRFACDPAQVGRTLAAAGEEMRRLRDEPAGADELERAKSALLAELATSFAAPRETVATYAGDDLLGWPHDFWRDYRERVMAVSADDVRRAARQSLRPEEMVTLVVGNWPERPRDVRMLPLRDPLSLEPVK